MEQSSMSDLQPPVDAPETTRGEPEQEHRPPMRPVIKGLIAAGVAMALTFLASLLLPQLFPHADHFEMGRQLGHDAVYFCLIAFFVTFLWASRQRALAVGCVGVVALFIAFGIWGVRSAVYRSADLFARSAEAGLTLTEVQGRQTLVHDGLGFQLDWPGQGFAVEPTATAQPGLFTWVYTSPEKAEVVQITVQHLKIASFDELTTFANGVIEGSQETSRGSGVALLVDDPVVTWDDKGGSVLIRGHLNMHHYRVRAVAFDSGYPGFHMVVGVMVVSPDEERAEALASSLQVNPELRWRPSPNTDSSKGA